MQKLSVPFNLPTLFHKYCPHSGICSFGQKISPDTQRIPELWITTSTLNPQQHRDLLYQQSILSLVLIHVPLWSPLQTVLSEELQVLESSAEIHERTWLLEVGLCWDLSTFVGLREKSTNSTIFRHLHILPVQFLGPVYVTEQSNPDCA